ncbi:hypothetical protein EKN56_07295 [Limnobaculum zhutongyuii]|uniref:Uncharacterized protein n=1 Tax=Limnobaculum zhutongyuii TaxID=2498113 RepID=A0A411WJ44_9GAMM|nr:putative type VI secretion system effector [Limnobaculum zhutongyuii]QBH96221.1 hypothetical protein EKN56_07295 [Limnobaculum zhutongyuii]TQS86186.1 hypothetical protein ELQ32_20045 [Limnobaculum zhutongyuii]
MNKLEDDKPFVFFSGIISDLQVVNDERDFILESELKNTGKAAAVGLAIAGVAGAAATALQSSVGAESEVQLFRCKVGDKLVTGCFSRVFFDNNEEVDIVAEPKEDGSYYAHAVRRTIDHRLWMPFYCEQGSLAYKKSKLTTSFWFSLILTFPCIILPIYVSLNIQGDFMEKIKVFAFTTLLLIFCFLLIMLIVYRLISKLAPFSVLAEKIFTCFGYEKPELLNMNHENSQFLKDCREYGEFYYVPDTKQYRQLLVAPCVFHYREAPEVPESSKLKE